MGGHRARRALWEGVIPNNGQHVSPCYSYRNLNKGESVAEYVTRLKDELEQKIVELEPKNVAAFICEPVVGAVSSEFLAAAPVRFKIRFGSKAETSLALAISIHRGATAFFELLMLTSSQALGCVPAEDGYLAAMREVCDRYGVLLIFDEVMCGMGRTGYTHAWQKEGVAPDIQTTGKGLAGGFEQISAMLVSPKISDAFEFGPGSGAFSHGHTFQNFPAACAAGLEVQKIIQEENLLQNVKEKGARLSKLLRKRLANHPNVGDIRGVGLFWGVSKT
jgi:adenosylmethionine-8-amino-7-oxononanoate aminotransferase